MSLLHISLANNTDFGRINQPDLRPFGDSVMDVWRKLVKKPGRFISVNTEELFGKFETDQHPELYEWYKYITERYSWLVDAGNCLKTTVFASLCHQSGRS